MTTYSPDRKWYTRVCHDGYEQIALRGIVTGLYIERIFHPNKGHIGWEKYRIVDRSKCIDKYAPKVAGLFPDLASAKAAYVLMIK